MKLFFDTTILVDLERQREGTVRLLEEATARDTELWISTVSVAEILMGANLRKDREIALLRAREALGRFVWQDFDGDAAARTAALLADTWAKGRGVEFQDTAIAGCALAARADHLITENKEHFARFAPLEGKVHTVSEFASKLKRL